MTRMRWERSCLRISGLFFMLPFLFSHVRAGLKPAPTTSLPPWPVAVICHSEAQPKNLSGEILRFAQDDSHPLSSAGRFANRPYNFLFPRPSRERARVRATCVRLILTPSLSLGKGRGRGRVSRCLQQHPPRPPPAPAPSPLRRKSPPRACRSSSPSRRRKIGRAH